MAERPSTVDTEWRFAVALPCRIHGWGCVTPRLRIHVHVRWLNRNGRSVCRRGCGGDGSCVCRVNEWRDFDIESRLDCWRSGASMGCFRLPPCNVRRSCCAARSGVVLCGERLRCVDVVLCALLCLVDTLVFAAGMLCSLPTPRSVAACLHRPHDLLPLARR